MERISLASQVIVREASWPQSSTLQILETKRWIILSVEVSATGAGSRLRIREKVVFHQDFMRNTRMESEVGVSALEQPASLIPSLLPWCRQFLLHRYLILSWVHNMSAVASTQRDSAWTFIFGSPPTKSVAVSASSCDLVHIAVGTRQNNQRKGSVDLARAMIPWSQNLTIAGLLRGLSCGFRCTQVYCIHRLIVGGFGRSRTTYCPETLVEKLIGYAGFSLCNR